ncbi:MAG: DUF6876 family protein [Mucilaginibacter sp.]|uniref:DUF6876 family protein n=1 Tax=Mucilaginibacter sp. TaxID=1882438 RepID=UPI0031B1731D
MKDLRLNNTIEFNQFLGGSENFYKYKFGILITDGVKYLADKYECYWLVDLISIHSRDIKDTQDFQVWILKRLTGSYFKLSVEDGNKNVIKVIDIPISHFEADEVHVWLENEVIYLPNER